MGCVGVEQRKGMALAMGAARWAVVAMAVMASMMDAGEAQETSCEKVLLSLSGCASFLTNPSSTPANATCCQPLQTVLTSPTSFQCLCAQATSSQSAGEQNALKLPEACKLGINVSASNCSSPSSSSTTPSTTPSSTTPAGSGGVVSAFPYATSIIAVALVCAAAL